MQRTAKRARSSYEVPIHQGPVLFDTNAILEACRVGAWPALTRQYAVETVEECVTETQTGWQRRPPDRRVEEHELRDALAAVHSVNIHQVAELVVQREAKAPSVALDSGETALWAHALGRRDNWVFCGPDTASMRVGVRLGYRERIVSLERLIEEIGVRPRRPLKRAYTERWLASTLNTIVLS